MRTARAARESHPSPDEIFAGGSLGAYLDLSFDDYTFHTTSAACLRIYLNAISQSGSEPSSLVTPPGREIANSLMVRRTNRFSRSLGAELFVVTRVSFCLQNGMSFPAISLSSSLSLSLSHVHIHTHFCSLSSLSRGLFRLRGYLIPPLSPLPSFEANEFIRANDSGR